MRGQAERPGRGTPASTLTLGLVVLAAGHLLLYVVLTADARSALADTTSRHEPAQLEAAKDPGHPPQPGTEAYSTWLRSYELWFAAKDYAVHGRHEGLVKGGMLLSFLVGLGLLGQGWMRATRRRPVQARGRRSQERARPARVIPMRPAAKPVAVRPRAVRPVAVRPRVVRPVPVARRKSA
ncbi:MAG: hypothetical protein QNJ90_10540 [Planctomycetota bacterium]|nr:hypothetical protein [Planctomycetota bacterium]